MYPLHSAQLRLAVLRLAANRAVDRAMRRLHDMPNTGEYLHGRLTHMSDEAREQYTTLFRAEVARRFHERMKVDESNCRWCGLAQREALEELEAQP